MNLTEVSELLPAKIGECVWWLAVLAQRMDLYFDHCVEKFISERLALLK